MLVSTASALGIGRPGPLARQARCMIYPYDACMQVLYMCIVGFPNPDVPCSRKKHAGCQSPVAWLHFPDDAHCCARPLSPTMRSMMTVVLHGDCWIIPGSTLHQWQHTWVLKRVNAPLTSLAVAPGDSATDMLCCPAPSGCPTAGAQTQRAQCGCAAYQCPADAKRSHATGWDTRQPLSMGPGRVPLQCWSHQPLKTSRNSLESKCTQNALCCSCWTLRCDAARAGGPYRSIVEDQCLCHCMNRCSAVCRADVLHAMAPRARSACWLKGSAMEGGHGCQCGLSLAVNASRARCTSCSCSTSGAS